jgi:hypothetical protein
MHVYIPDFTGVGTTQSSISDVDIQLSVIDPYNGAAFGTAGVPGSPFNYGVSIERANPAYGLFSDITLDVTVNGTWLSGIFVGPNMDDAVYIRRARLTNINNDTSATYGGVSTQSRLAVGLDMSISTLGGTPYVYPNGTGSVVGFVDHVYYGAFAGANVSTQRPWAPPFRCQVTKIELINSAAITQSDTNYLSLDFRRIGGSGTAFALPNTKVTGGTTNNPNMHVVANALVTAVDGVTNTNRAELVFPKDAQLQIAKTVNGTGASLADSRFRISYAPC